MGDGHRPGLNAIYVCAKDVSVVHSVRLKDCTAWLERTARVSEGRSNRARIKDILGLSQARRGRTCNIRAALVMIPTRVIFE